jgi:2-keto-4-pentenoate hydratase
LERLGRSGGWKVAAKPDSEPRCAVIPACNFYQSGALIPVPDAGFDVEVEVAFVFARDLVGRETPYAADEVADAIDPYILPSNYFFALRRSQETVTLVTDRRLAKRRRDPWPA